MFKNMPLAQNKADGSVNSPPAQTAARPAGPGRTLATLLFLATAWVHLTAAWPQSAHYTADTDEMLWFLAITDSHIGQGIMGSDQDSNNLTWALTELFQTVNPSFLVNGGDLVDATGGGAIPVGQFDKEWNEYHDIVTAAGMSPEFYFDLPGNHDNYAEWPMDHYLTSSIQGAANGRLNHRWTRTDAKGNKYLFLGLATNGSDNSFWIDDPGLDDTDIAFGNETFANNTDANIAVIIGHHPVANFKDGEETLINWFLDHAVSTYIFGHTHDYSVNWDDGTLQVNIRSTAKNDDRQIGLFAFDGLGMSAKVFDVAAWPQVLITTPVDSGLGSNNPYDYMIPDSLTDARVRAIAFHPDGVASVTAILDGSIEIPMEVVDENVWEGLFDASTLSDEGPHTLKVVANAWDKTNDHQITFYVFHDETPPDPVEPNPEYEDISSGEPSQDVIEQSDLESSDLIEETMDSETGELGTEDLHQESDLHDTTDALLADQHTPLDTATSPDLPQPPDQSVADASKDGSPNASDLVSTQDVAGDSGEEPDTTATTPEKKGKSGGCSAAATPGSASAWPLGTLLLLLYLVARRKHATPQATV